MFEKIEIFCIKIKTPKPICSLFILLCFPTYLINSQTIEKNQTQLNTNNTKSHIPCGNNNFCHYSQGYCQETYNDNIKNQTCICFPEFTTLENEDNIMCNYIKKSQLKAFILELIFSNGTGHFYLENYYFAIPKLFLWVFAYYFFIVLRITCKNSEENIKTTLMLGLVACCFCIGMLFWQIFDLVYLGMNKYKDGNGMEMYSWFKT